MRRNYQTQWASQFYAAAELTRRGYLVSLTFGNAPESDLLVHSDYSDNNFTVDVKGQSSMNFWLIQPRKPNPNHYFILVYLPSGYKQPKYFIISSDMLMKKREEYKNRMMPKGKYKDALGGINWSTALECENKWDDLPK